MRTDISASRVIRQCINREKDITKRGQILKEAIENTSGLYLPVLKVSLEVRRDERQDGSGLVTEEHLKRLQQLCAEKIRSAAKSGVLRAHPQMAYILFRWNEWGTAEEARQWVENLVSSDSGTLCFLAAFLQYGTQQDMGSYAMRVYPFISLKGIETFVSVSDLQVKVDHISSDSLGKTESEAVRAFKNALKRRIEGKSDDEPWDAEDE